MKKKSISKDKIMKDLFRFPKETLLFTKEVARLNEDLLLENTIERLLNEPSLKYTMHRLNEEKTSSQDENRIKRLDLALEFATAEEQLDFIIFIENQTSNDRAMLFRMMEYITATMLEKLESKDYDFNKGLPRPIPILIYLSQEDCKMPKNIEAYFKSSSISENTLAFQVNLVDLGGTAFQQVLENLSAPGIFLQLMKALYTKDQKAFKEQQNLLEQNLKSKEQEVRQYYKNKVGLLLTELVELIARTGQIDESEVCEMALSIKELVGIEQVEGEAKISITINNYNKYRQFEEVRQGLYNDLMTLFEEYHLTPIEQKEYLQQLKQ